MYNLETLILWKNKKKITSILIIAVAIATIFTSCKKEPTASFTYTPEHPVLNDTLEFTNTSSDANTYLWDFGGTLSSIEKNPKIIALTAGDVVVKLTATGEGGSQTIEKTITITKPDN